MESCPNKVLSPRNRNISSSTGLAKFNLSPKRINPKNDLAYALQYEPPFRANADLERKASFHKARSVFDNPSQNKENGALGLTKSPEMKLRHKPSSPFRPPPFAVEATVSQTDQNSPKNGLGLSRAELLSKYASKQTRLLEIQREKEVLEFEILEIEAELHKNVGPPSSSFMDSVYTRANTDMSLLKNKVSTIFGPELRKSASTIFSPDSGTKLRPPAGSGSPRTIKKTASSIFSPPPNLTNLPNLPNLPNIMPSQDLKKKASHIFNTKLNEVRGKLDQQQNEFEEFTKKGTEFAKSLISSLSPKKESKESIFAESSFLVDNLADSSLIDRSVLLSDSESDLDGSGIDIDDYYSDEEKENY
ncbi:hypothetical protein OXX69_005690 [Metschnikowia pulcherrima]